MRFGPVPLAVAQGAILAHSVALPDGTLRKGSVLGPNDIAALAALGMEQVVVARLDPGDVHEDAAASRIGAALLPDPEAMGLRLSAAGTGRVNLFATGPGILAVDGTAVTAMNRINPMITLACLPPWARVAAGTMVATIKIISYGVGTGDLDRACAAIGPALHVRPPLVRTAALIETETPGHVASDKGRKALALRLTRLGLDLTECSRVPHDVDAIARAMQQTGAEMIFVLTASATSDPGDVGPLALRAAGGQMVQFGIPVDPGNLLFLGNLGQRPVIGLPGCARSPALNGADWVMERVICGVPPGPDDMAAMGVGGLLKETAVRGLLRGG